MLVKESITKFLSGKKKEELKAIVAQKTDSLDHALIGLCVDLWIDYGLKPMGMDDISYWDNYIEVMNDDGWAITIKRKADGHFVVTVDTYLTGIWYKRVPREKNLTLGETRDVSEVAKMIASATDDFMRNKGIAF